MMDSTEIVGWKLEQDNGSDVRQKEYVLAESEGGT